ncbi:hypothetical protein DdX_08997 [Ditylenchus destructor]|uniref:Uncharacterized protein n=1 Tax=Ditylenchus destructor TaxID=166010 RepID=A0AAD4N5C6_9BILA|nr:hypothetical protein DdX_08997 [Ditylenchus destructor]
MESITSNLTSQINRHGDYKLRLGRAAPYTWAKAAEPLPKHLVKCPKCLVLADTRLHAKCPMDQLYQEPYIWNDPGRWYP